MALRTEPADGAPRRALKPRPAGKTGGSRFDDLDDGAAEQGFQPGADAKGVEAGLIVHGHEGLDFSLIDLGECFACLADDGADFVDGGEGHFGPKGRKGGQAGDEFRNHGVDARHHPRQLGLKVLPNVER